TNAGAGLIMDPRQQDAEFSRNAGSGFLLQAALAQHTFEKSAVAKQACSRVISRQPVRYPALEHRFPTWREAVVDPHIGRKERAFGFFTKILDRSQLNFHFARFRHSRIRAVEWTIGLGSAAPEGKHSCRSERRGCPLPLHGTGRNTQI